jgi:hypothetical protein
MMLVQKYAVTSPTFIIQGLHLHNHATAPRENFFDYHLSRSATPFQ